MISLLKEFGRGQITLPKKWRDRYDTKVYIAKETSQGLLIIPFQDEAVKVNEDKLKIESENKSFANLFKRKTINPSNSLRTGKGG
jgi:bifunctional DNA-binding transcriptional regulator/antitoxin component of YhaV-PrlF toxin-antitoxin module